MIKCAIQSHSLINRLSFKLRGMTIIYSLKKTFSSGRKMSHYKCMKKIFKKKEKHGSTLLVLQQHCSHEGTVATMVLFARLPMHRQAFVRARGDRWSHMWGADEIRVRGAMISHGQSMFG